MFRHIYRVIALHVLVFICDLWCWEHKIYILKYFFNNTLWLSPDTIGQNKSGRYNRFRSVFPSTSISLLLPDHVSGSVKVRDGSIIIVISKRLWTRSLCHLKKNMYDIYYCSVITCIWFEDIEYLTRKNDLFFRLLSSDVLPIYLFQRFFNVKVSQQKV